MKRLNVIIMGFLAALLGACMGGNENVQSVDVDTFEQLMAAEGELQLLDVRTPSEFAGGHIPGAVNVDVQQDDFVKSATEHVAKEHKVYVYCRSGKRSMIAAIQLAKDGYQIVNLKGGIIEWEGSEKPLER